jgi:hypothetical protein
MDRIYFRYVVVLVMATSAGCAMCDSSQDGAYGAFGGRWQRTDPFCGRVGSVIDPAGVDTKGAQSVASMDEEKTDNDSQSVLRRESTDRQGSEPMDDLDSDVILIEEAPNEPPEAMGADESAVGGIAPNAQTESTADPASGSPLPEDGIPDLFKDLGIDPDSSATSEAVDNTSPPVDTDGGLPSLFPGGDQ